MRNTENHSANNAYISASNRCQELSKNDDIENESNTEDYVKPTKAAESNKTNSGKRNNSNTRKKSTNPIIQRHKKAQQHVKEYDNVIVILGDSMVKDLKRWELSNDNQNVVVKSFNGPKTSNMHWHVKPTIEIIIHCGTNDISKDMDPEKIAADIINLSKSVGEESGSNAIIFGLVPPKGYLNAKLRNVNNRLRDYCRNRMLTFLKYENINAKTHSNISGVHLNSKGVSLFNKNFVNLLNILDSEN